jgi:hypothetical protein
MQAYNAIRSLSINGENDIGEDENETEENKST